jgi:hypothetical protein
MKNKILLGIMIFTIVSISVLNINLIVNNGVSNMFLSDIEAMATFEYRDDDYGGDEDDGSLQKHREISYICPIEHPIDPSGLGLDDYPIIRIGIACQFTGNSSDYCRVVECD